MTASQFRASLKSLRLRQRWLAEHLGVDNHTVSRWATGQLPVPQYAVFALTLIAAQPDLSASLARGRSELGMD